MKSFRPFFIALCLASCGEAKLGCDGYGCHYDLSTPDGVRFRNDPPTIIFDQAGMEHFIAEPYREVEVCAQIVTGGPLVIALPALNVGIEGETFNDGVIVITDGGAISSWDSNPATGAPPYSALRHEYVHHLLNAVGFPIGDNRCHRSPLFLACSGHSGTVC
jgi:hypothetical protein